MNVFTATVGTYLLDKITSPQTPDMDSVKRSNLGWAFVSLWFECVQYFPETLVRDRVTQRLSKWLTVTLLVARGTNNTEQELLAWTDFRMALLNYWTECK